MGISKSKKSIDFEGMKTRLARLKTSGESFSFGFGTQFESGLAQLSSVNVFSLMRCFATSVASILG